MRKILIVDDDDDFSDYLGRCLDIFGFKAARASNGSAGVKLAKEFAPDLILLDWILKSGFSSQDVLLALKDDNDTHGVPVVMISGIKESPEDAETARRFGAELFLTKLEITDNPKMLLRHLKCLLAGPSWKFPRSILVIADDQELQSSASAAAASLRCELRSASKGEEGLRLAAASRPSLIIMKTSLPDFNGVMLAKLFREGEKTRHVPLIMAGEETGEDASLASLGVQAFLKVPVASDQLREVIAKTFGAAPASPFPVRHILHRGPLRVDVDARLVWVGGESRRLGPRRFDLLCALMRAQGTVSREALLTELWEGEGDPQTLDKTVQRLRRDLGPNGAAAVVAVPGGYRLIDDLLIP